MLNDEDRVGGGENDVGGMGGHGTDGKRKP